MISLKGFLSDLFMYFEKLKGRKTVHEIKLPKNALGQLAGYAIDGYEIRIYCQKKQYKRAYISRLVPDRNTVVYRVFSVVSNDAPSFLREACELDVDIPCQLSPLVDDEGQKEAAIQAYLDLLAAKLDTMPKTPAA